MGPALEHYRCVLVYLPRTRAVRPVDTVQLFPTVLKVSKIALEDYLRQAGSDIIALLTNPPSSTVLDLKAGNSTYNALLQLATILKTAEDISYLPAIKHSSESSLLPRAAKSVQEPRVTIISK